MAMIKCRECGREISSEATTCPNCGCPVSNETIEQGVVITETPLPKKTGKKKISVLAIVGILLVVICVGFFANSKDNLYEKCAYETAAALKGILKNPDSLSVYDVEFYVSNAQGDNEDRNTLTDEKHPIVIMHYTAQNGYGGNTTGYVISSYYKDSESYEIVGYTYTLDASEISKYDDDADWQKITILLIKACRKNNQQVGSIDVKKLNRKIKNN